MPGGIDNTGSTGSTSFNTELPSQAGQTKQVGKSFSRTISLTKNEPGIPVALNKLQEQKPVPQGLQHNTISKESTNIQTLAGKSTEVAKQRLNLPSPPKKGTPPTAPSSARPPGPPVHPRPLGSPPAAPSFARPAGPPVRSPPPPSAATAQPATSSPIRQNSPAAPTYDPPKPPKNFKTEHTCDLEVQLTPKEHEALATRRFELKLTPLDWKNRLLTENPKTFTKAEWDKLDDKQKVVAYAKIFVERNQFAARTNPPVNLGISQKAWNKMSPSEKWKLHLETVPTVKQGRFTSGEECKLTKEEAQALQSLHKKSHAIFQALVNNPPNVPPNKPLHHLEEKLRAAAQHLIELKKCVNSPKVPDIAKGLINDAEWKSASKAKRARIYTDAVKMGSFLLGKQIEAGRIPF